VPLIEVTGLRSGQAIELSVGRLYSAVFKLIILVHLILNFLLSASGCFAGINKIKQSHCMIHLFWRMVARKSDCSKAHVMGAMYPEGSLSSLVLGS
jgi:hypothetical protein